MTFDPEIDNVKRDGRPGEMTWFQRKVYTVTDGVYQAVGFGIANSIMVEGDDCVFTVDVMGSSPL